MASPLNIAQSELVRANLGLVGVHLRRALDGRRHSRRDREFDDLFQEGCLGLIRAARGYDPGSGMTFATYALPRIRHAVSESVNLQSRGALESPATQRQSNPPQPPTFVPRRVSAAVLDRLVDSRPGGAGGADVETLGDRMWALYGAAVRDAAEVLAGGAPRSDRPALLRTLVEERLLIRREDARRPIRRIAKELESSYGRVVQCERQLRQQAGDALRRHPEFLALCFAAAHHDTGVRTPIDDAMEALLAERSAEEVVAAYAALPLESRAFFAHAVLSAEADSVSGLLRVRVRSMSPVERAAACRAARIAVENTARTGPRPLDPVSAALRADAAPRALAVGRPRRAPSRRHDPDSPTELVLAEFHGSRPPRRTRRTAHRKAPA